MKKPEGGRTVSKHVIKQKCGLMVNIFSKSHPLHKAGTYKGFEEAAFSSLQNFKDSPQGQVYIITNPAWEGWVKVGMAVDANDRAGNYQTASPYRDYELCPCSGNTRIVELRKQRHTLD